MAKITKDELATYKREQKAKTHEDLHLVVPKDVAAAFRKAAKSAGASPDAFFEEMVAAFASGMNPIS